MTKPFDPDRLVGAWSLVRWYVTYPDGSVTEPLGPGAEGLLVYTADGWMSAAMMARDRPRLSHRNPRSAPALERATGTGGYDPDTLDQNARPHAHFVGRGAGCGRYASPPAAVAKRRR